MLHAFLAALLSTSAAAAGPSPNQIAQSAPGSEWITISDDDLLVITLAGNGDTAAERRVVIELMPAPIASGWVANIRRLAAAHWWDGTSINRVQDNYVAQWGDASEKKPLPPGLAIISERDYDLPWGALAQSGATPSITTNVGPRPADVYAAAVLWYRGFPLATDAKPVRQGRRVWPVHCYGSVGVGRNLSPDTGSGAELYAVIGHAPRHLDRNIAVVGRIIEGMEQLSSMPRGTGDLGFYATPGERVGITSVRLASELPAADRPHFAYLSSTGVTWPRYVAARRNRELPFFTRPAGAADVCNIPVPIKVVPVAK